MDDRGFDALTRSLGGGIARRRFAGGLVGGIAGALLGRPQRAAAAARCGKKKCGRGRSCVDTDPALRPTRCCPKSRQFVDENAAPVVFCCAREGVCGDECCYPELEFCHESEQCCQPVDVCGDGCCPGAVSDSRPFAACYCGECITPDSRLPICSDSAECCGGGSCLPEYDLETPRGRTVCCPPKLQETVGARGSSEVASPRAGGGGPFTRCQRSAQGGGGRIPRYRAWG